MTHAFNSRLSALADICLKVGVNIQRGQELIVTAPIEASALVHHIVRIAYQQGAKLVTCLYEDPRLIHERLLHAEDSTLDYGPAWLSRGTSEALENGAARLYVVGPYPDLLAGVPADKIVRVHASAGLAASVEIKFTSESRINWSTVPFVTDSWARTVFSDLPPEAASQKLWDAVFDVTRVNHRDPILAWKEHDRSLTARRDFLQNKQYAALHFYDGRTDLTVGLADGHRWVGGTVVAANGIECVCNIPTEEIFTSPHRERTNGLFFFSKPLVLAGTLVDDVCIEFRDGRAVSIKAEKGRELLEKLLLSDDGTRRLGEVGLVPNSSLVAASKTLFYNPLFDENAASHVAFGQSYAACLTDDNGTPRSAQRAGANQSSIHIDCMLGNSSMSVDGVHRSGAVEPIMRAGEFLASAGE